MSKKYEFRPDSDGKNLLQKLHFTDQQRKNALKWVLYTLFLQYTIGARFLGFLLTAGLSILVSPLLYFPAKAINAIGGDPWKE